AKIQAVYDRISIDTDLRQNLEAMVRDALKTMNVDTDEERRRLETDKLRIERKQKKLLEAHYNDAIPVDLLRTEQKQLEVDLAAVLRSLETQIQDLNELDRLITLVLDIAENLGESYRAAPPHIRRMLNQLIFKRIKVFFDPGTFESSAEGELADTFAFLGEQEIRLAAREFALQRKGPAVSDRPFADISHSSNALSYAYGLSKSIVVREGGLELIRSPSHTKSRIRVLPHDFAAGSKCACG
ncbi:MAG: hypothetical protein WDA07_13510, partial [Leucobacter sp.]